MYFLQIYIHLICIICFLPASELEDDCTKKVAAQTQKLDHFWSGLRPHLDSGPPNSKLHDVAELSFTVHIPSVNQQDPEAMVS